MTEYTSNVNCNGLSVHKGAKNMTKRKTGLTEKKISEMEKEGRGQGKGENYKPWIKIQDFPSIIVDKYHVVQKVTQALDQVRKKIPGLKKARFHLLRSYENVKEKDKPRLNELLETHEI
jgi:hypothetical protein